MEVTGIDEKTSTISFKCINNDPNHKCNLECKKSNSNNFTMLPNSDPWKYIDIGIDNMNNSYSNSNSNSNSSNYNNNNDKLKKNLRVFDIKNKKWYHGQVECIQGNNSNGINLMQIEAMELNVNYNCNSNDIPYRRLNICENPYYCFTWGFVYYWYQSTSPLCTTRTRRDGKHYAIPIDDSDSSSESSSNEKEEQDDDIDIVDQRKQVRKENKAERRNEEAIDLISDSDDDDGEDLDDENQIYNALHMYKKRLRTGEGKNQSMAKYNKKEKSKDKKMNKIKEKTNNKNKNKNKNKKKNKFKNKNKDEKTNNKRGMKGTDKYRYAMDDRRVLGTEQIENATKYFEASNNECEYIVSFQLRDMITNEAISNQDNCKTPCYYYQSGKIGVQLEIKQSRDEVCPFEYGNNYNHNENGHGNKNKKNGKKQFQLRLDLCPISFGINEGKDANGWYHWSDIFKLVDDKEAIEVNEEKGTVTYLFEAIVPKCHAPDVYAFSAQYENRDSTIKDIYYTSLFEIRSPYLYYMRLHRILEINALTCVFNTKQYHQFGQGLGQYKGAPSDFFYINGVGCNIPQDDDLEEFFQMKKHFMQYNTHCCVCKSMGIDNEAEIHKTEAESKDTQQTQCGGGCGTWQHDKCRQVKNTLIKQFVTRLNIKIDNDDEIFDHCFKCSLERMIIWYHELLRKQRNDDNYNLGRDCSNIDGNNSDDQYSSGNNDSIRNDSSDSKSNDGNNNSDCSCSDSKSDRSYSSENDNYSNSGDHELSIDNNKRDDEVLEDFESYVVNLMEMLQVTDDYRRRNVKLKKQYAEKKNEYENIVQQWGDQIGLNILREMCNNRGYTSKNKTKKELIQTLTDPNKPLLTKTPMSPANYLVNVCKNGLKKKNCQPFDGKRWRYFDCMAGNGNITMQILNCIDECNVVAVEIEDEKYECGIERTHQVLKATEKRFNQLNNKNKNKNEKHHKKRGSRLILQNSHDDGDSDGDDENENENKSDKIDIKGTSRQEMKWINTDMLSKDFIVHTVLRREENDGNPFDSVLSNPAFEFGFATIMIALLAVAGNENAEIGVLAPLGYFGSTDKRKEKYNILPFAITEEHELGYLPYYQERSEKMNKQTPDALYKIKWGRNNKYQWTKFNPAAAGLV